MIKFFLSSWVIPWISNGSPTICSIFILGLIDSYGSWYTIWHCIRIFFKLELLEISSFSKNTFPESGSIAFKINFARVDFPEPDSPAIANISPWLSANVTSSVALTIVFLELKMLFFSNIFVRFSTLSISLIILYILLGYIRMLLLLNKAFIYLKFFVDYEIGNHIGNIRI